jgi:hypothetical protein
MSETRDPLMNDSGMPVPDGDFAGGTPAPTGPRQQLSGGAVHAMNDVPIWPDEQDALGSPDEADGTARRRLGNIAGQARTTTKVALAAATSRPVPTALLVAGSAIAATLILSRTRGRKRHPVSGRETEPSGAGPVATAVAGLSAGLLAGWLVPLSDAEARTLGNFRETLMSRALDALHEAGSNNQTGGSARTTASDQEVGRADADRGGVMA